MSKKTRRVRARPHASSSPPPLGTPPVAPQQEAAEQRSGEAKFPPLTYPGSRDLLLSHSLAVAVPLEIDVLYRNFMGWDGIPPWMVAEAIMFGRVLAERGDRLLYRSERKGETADMFVALSRAIAIMSFVPLGVPFGEQRFEAIQMLTNWYGEKAVQPFCKKALNPYWNAEITEIPVACWTDGSESIAFGSYRALHWFERASSNDLLRIREASYRGRATWIPDIHAPSDYNHSLLLHVFEQAQDRMRWTSATEEPPSVQVLGDQQLLAARDSFQEIAFQIDEEAAKAWLALYRHSLLTGERWLLPPEEPQRQRKSK